MNKSKQSSIIKNNIVVSISDLLLRFPNTVQPHIGLLYQNLHDKDPRVRKTTLTMVHHLSENDMIKVKNDLCEIAMLLKDEKSEISSLAKQFFR